MEEKEKEKVISIFCDYCADGLWLNGAAIDATYLEDDLNWDKEFVARITPMLDKWQEMYEGFNFYSSLKMSQIIYKSPKFKEFEKLGLEIYEEMKAYEQDPNNYHIIEYLDEKTGERTRD